MIFTRRNYFIRYFYNYFSSAENFPVNAQALIDASSKHTPVFVHKSIDRTSPPSVRARQILEETGRVVSIPADRNLGKYFRITPPRLYVFIGNKLRIKIHPFSSNKECRIDALGVLSNCSSRKCERSA